MPLFRSIRKVLLARKAAQRYSGPDNFVFGTSVGTPMDPNNYVKREFKGAITRANKKRAEDELEPLPSFRWHDLRHYAVSVLIRHAGPPRSV